jgi:photosystem II stability/assembly factor-like uncharacterized protein
MYWLYDVSFVGVDTGTAVGDNGIILHTTNGGSTWTGQSSGTLSSFNDVCFVDTHTGTVVGPAGVILRTTNAGETWTSQSSGTTNPLFSVSFTDADNGTAVGRAGTILRTTNGGAVFVDEDPEAFAPDGFVLDQNYPNPFNPTTKIQFTMVNRQSTIVKVYDVLGRDIATLVNEVREPGTYTVQWDASGTASGVYFCRLEAGPFVATRKLLLMRKSYESQGGSL